MNTRTRLTRLTLARLGDESSDIRLGQLLCFAAGPALLLVAAHAVGRTASSPGEVVIGLLAALGICVQSIILGLVFPLARRS